MIVTESKEIITKKYYTGNLLEQDIVKKPITHNIATVLKESKNMTSKKDDYIRRRTKN